jgi:hypothetical protein
METNMWLPKDEKKLFLYYAKLAKAGEACEVSDEELLKQLELPSVKKLHELKSKLKKRGLITFAGFEPETHILNVKGEKAPVTSKNPVVRLTDFGEELAEKYRKPFGTLEILCKEYGWLCTLLILIIAILSLIVGLIKIFIN